jgi:hypothetical protein
MIKRLILISTINLSSAEEWLHRSDKGSYCGYLCMELGNIWCADNDWKKGTCYYHNTFSEEVFNRSSKGDYNNCSNNYSKFEGVKYVLCPIQENCDGSRAMEAETYIPGIDGETK